VIVVLQVQGQHQATSASRTAGLCSPAPCADAGGYKVHVDQVSSSGGLVHVEVSFAVHGRRNMHAVPDDFSLLEAGGRRDRPQFHPSAVCPRWPRTNIPDGGRLGPRVLCFRTAGEAGELTLHWDPDLGITEYFSSGYDIKIGAPVPASGPGAPTTSPR
jgi:hypothetical protein